MKVIHTDNAPAAVGPYSQGMEVGEFVFTSGQIPVNPATGELITDIREATKQCLENGKAILNEAGLGLEDVVKVTIFILDMGEFQKVNEEYGKYFDTHKPTRSCVAVTALPAGANVEMEFIAKK